jgi:hypothetical protein
MTVIATLINFGFVVGLWGWACFLFATCMVAEQKNRSAFWAFVAFVITGPAALYYYFAVPKLEPKGQQPVVHA